MAATMQELQNLFPRYFGDDATEEVWSVSEGRREVGTTGVCGRVERRGVQRVQREQRG